ncbi:hypothetical protein P389DRAFT_210460 [Cystobasidium minutum MCA 4210]|uniref:uncharacterized protein n=1 Tax=Cystobasidium minutum MCA 4210 TaxID=1397322 RepID=UPI0034CD90E8|eukprot:jgi/Rhomi1/210460/estExt_Genemark1.C_3_t30234
MLHSPLRLNCLQGVMRLPSKIGRSYVATCRASSTQAVHATPSPNSMNLSLLTSALPKASQKLRFTTINPESNDNIYPEPLRLKGSSPSAVHVSNPWNPEWPATAWSCLYFSIKATPPRRAASRKRSQNVASPFPRTVPPKSRADFGEPALAFDHIVLQDSAIPFKEKAIVRAEAKRHKSYAMSLTIIVGKKKIHKLSTVRAQIRKRVRAAVRLFVQAGMTSDEKGNADCKDIRGPAHHLLPGHYYTMATSLDLYRMPMDKLLPLISEGLTKIYHLGQVQLVEEKFKEESAQAQARLDKMSSSGKASDEASDAFQQMT